MLRSLLFLSRHLLIAESLPEILIRNFGMRRIPSDLEIVSRMKHLFATCRKSLPRLVEQPWYIILFIRAQHPLVALTKLC